MSTRSNRVEPDLIRLNPIRLGLTFPEHSRVPGLLKAYFENFFVGLTFCRLSSEFRTPMEPPTVSISQRKMHQSAMWEHRLASSVRMFLPPIMILSHHPRFCRHCQHLLSLGTSDRKTVRKWIRLFMTAVSYLTDIVVSRMHSCRMYFLLI